jgi:hypothetical protein
LGITGTLSECRSGHEMEKKRRNVASAGMRWCGAATEDG